MTLYRKELGRILISMVFLLSAGVMVLFAYTQGVFLPVSVITKPEPGATAYGTKASEDPALIMPEAAESLFVQYSVNQYTTYPNGFIKYVRLNQADREKMNKIIAELSADGIPDNLQEAEAVPAASNEAIMPEGEVPIDFRFNASMNWEHFSELMAEVDNLLGGGSDFSTTWISHRYGQIPVTYEEALADYRLTVSEDKLTGAHARLFSDYMGIILGLVPVFPAVFLCLGDRKNIAPLLHTRRISSVHFILARFLSLLTAVMIPVLMMCGVLTVIHMADYGLGNIDLLAYFKYALFWLLPTAMAATAVGLFLTTLTNTPVAIAAQLVWWFTDTIGGNGTYSFIGVRSLQLIPRHNALGQTSAYMDYLPNLIQNRIWMAMIAVLLVVLTVLIYSIKRRGVLYVPVFKHSKI